MEIEEEQEEEIDDELLKKFSKHKTTYNNNIFQNSNQTKKNKKDIFVKCIFDKNSVENNQKLLEEYEKSGLIKTQHYFAFDKEELEDPIDPKKIKKDKNIENNYFLFEKDVENSDLYCGYLDNLNLQKVKNINKSIVSCPYCFNLISNNILENKTELGYIIIGKSDKIFKDFSSEMMNFTEAKKLFKDNKGIKNYENEFNKREKEMNLNFEEKKNNEEIDNDEDIEMSENKKKYVIISCVNCGNIIGLCNTVDNTKIILDYL